MQEQLLGGWHSTILASARKRGFQNPGNFCSWNQEFNKFCLWYPESRVFESVIQLEESGIPLTTEIQNSSSVDKDQNPRFEIQNPRLALY